jgi:membrane associated rhomboid family serine protease
MFPLRDSVPCRHTPVVTYALVAINVLVYLWFSRQPQLVQEELLYRRGFVPARISQLSNHRPIEVEIKFEATGIFGQPIVQARAMVLPPDPAQILFSLLTCMFLHGGWMHVIGNMWFLWIFGDNVEDRLGSALYLVFYLLGGIAASTCQWMLDPASQQPMIGASGAIAAVLGAYAITWPTARVQTLIFLVVFVTIIELPALLVLGIWFLTQLLEGYHALKLNVGGGVAWWAHVGGFAAGLLLMPLFSQLAGATPSPPESNRFSD